MHSRRPARKGFYQSNELGDFPDFGWERFPGELASHLKFHNVGSLSLYRCNTFSR